MKVIIRRLTTIYPTSNLFHLSMLLLRIAVSIELIVAHGLKKLGIGVAMVEQIPNPLQLPEIFNQGFALASNLIFPVFVILGLFTRVAILPILAVTLTGYFVLHWHDALLVKDVPFMYSVVYLLILALGPGKYSIDYILNKKLSL
ncbi:DoxX family protein [Lacibacter sediminis]|uniref:DoxX family protein n=1 Tax=Lacibacter sediminis TaxID=2760713 RepID=A0A7G5XK96_9BACT|nr:DoxX family protein [Lacibacter sediminis]QNA45899.1 DoxX family protein [Lacibacter sediminis]